MDADSKERAAGREELRQRVFDRDGRRCVECGSTERLTLDHIWPRSRGGSDTFDNLQTMCAPCNGQKGDNVDLVKVVHGRPLYEGGPRRVALADLHPDLQRALRA